jgi:uncharacterized membrane protein
MDDVKRGEVLQGQARINTAAAFAVAFAVIAVVSRLDQSNAKASHYGKKPYKCRTVSNLRKSKSR